MEKELQLTSEQVKACGYQEGPEGKLQGGSENVKWQDEHERRYRRIVYEMGLETGMI